MPDTDVQAVTVRLPADLYEQLRTAAFAQHISQNEICVRALESALNGKGRFDDTTIGGV